MMARTDGPPPQVGRGRGALGVLLGALVVGAVLAGCARMPTLEAEEREFAISWGVLLAEILAVAHVFGFISSLRAIMDVRTPQGTIAWVMALNALPLFSLPAYWVFGRNKFQSYKLRRRRGAERNDPLAREVIEAYRSSRFIAEHDSPDASVLTRLAKLPITNANDVQLLIDGHETFDAIFEAIDAAQHYILVEFYILRCDDLGTRFRDRLAAKARAGVRVYVLYDEMGSNKLSKDYLKFCADAGIDIREFGSYRRAFMNRLQLNFRNHRKIVVVDGRTAFVGGHNVGDEYLGLDKQLGHWRDTHVRITGPVVPLVQVAWLEDWMWAEGTVPDLIWKPETSQRGGNKRVLCLPSGPADDVETCGLFFHHAISRARKRLWIASPYFVPDETIVAALQLAALRGVDVRILMPNTYDQMLPYLSSFSYLQQLQESGVRLFRYMDGFMHQKVMLVDDFWSAIGTANFDNRSFRLNFEITMLVVDQPFNAEVAAMLERDLEKCEETDYARDLNAKPLWFRVAVRAARLTAPIQ